MAVRFPQMSMICWNRCETEVALRRLNIRRAAHVVSVNDGDWGDAVNRKLSRALRKRGRNVQPVSVLRSNSRDWSTTRPIGSAASRDTQNDCLTGRPKLAIFRSGWQLRKNRSPQTGISFLTSLLGLSTCEPPVFAQYRSVRLQVYCSR